MVQATIVMTGITELQRSLKAMDKNLRKEVQDRFKKVGQIIADRAKSNVKSVTVTRTGDLSTKIRASSLTRGIKITAFAKHGGYNYPGRIEFDPRGPRPFLYPALEQEREPAFRELEGVLDYLEREWLR